jgi:hypothetical protein
MRKRWFKRTTSWVTLWAVAIVTYIVWNHSPEPWAPSVVTMCSAIVLAYVTAHGAVDFKHGPEMEDPKGGGP